MELDVENWNEGSQPENENEEIINMTDEDMCVMTNKLISRSEAITSLNTVCSGWSADEKQLSNINHSWRLETNVYSKSCNIQIKQAKLTSFIHPIK